MLLFYIHVCMLNCRLTSPGASLSFVSEIGGMLVLKLDCPVLSIAENRGVEMQYELNMSF